MYELEPRNEDSTEATPPPPKESLNVMGRAICTFIANWVQAPMPERGTFRKWWSSVLSLIGYSIGLGNLWRFPYLCSKHYGVTFLIPYLVAMTIIGFPLFFLELALGQYVSWAPTLLFYHLCPALSGIGYAMILIQFAFIVHYILAIAWTLFYLGATATFSDPLPWGSCNYTYMSPNCSSETVRGRLVAAKFYFEKIVLDEPILGESPADADNVNVMMIVSLAVSWLLVCMALAGGIKSTKKVLICTVFFPYIMLGFILAWAVDNTEDSALPTDIIPKNLLSINTTYLLQEKDVWIDAASQVIYSLGVAYGGISTIASYNTLKQNILRDSIIVCLLDILTSIFCAYVVLSVSHFMSEDFLNMNHTSPALVFVTFPAMVSQLGKFGVWAMLFFFMILTLGFDSQLMMTKTVTTALFDEFEVLRRCYVPVLAICCIVFFILGVPMTLPGGKKIFDLIDKYSSSHSLLLVGFLEIITVVYIYGFKKFTTTIKKTLDVSIPAPLYYFWMITWKFLTPISLLILLGFSFYSEYEKVWKTEKDFDVLFILGVILSFSAFIIVPLRMLYVVVKKIAKDGTKNIRDIWRASNSFRPEHERREMDPDLLNGIQRVYVLDPS